MRSVAAAVGALLCLLPSPVLAGSFSTSTTPLATQSISAIFNGNAAKIATNFRGSILGYQASTSQPTTYLSQREIVTFYAGDPITTAPVNILDVTGAMNAPCVAATSTGEFWAAVADFTTNIVYVYRWADPTASTTPTLWTFASDQGQNGKWSCAYDEMRRKFYFIGTGFELLMVDDSGTSTKQKLLAQTSSSHGIYYAEYPNISIGDDGYIHLVWTTTDTTSAVPQYHGIQYMQSPNGGANWSPNGLAPWIATPTTQVVPDESGTSLLANYFGEFLNRNTFLTAFQQFGEKLYFAFMVGPNAGERCMANPRCTVAMTIFPRWPISTTLAEAKRPFMASDYSIPHATSYLQLVRRGSDLYLIAAGTGTLAAYRLDRATGNFDKVAVTDPRSDPSTSCVAGLTADMTNRNADDILGAVSIVKYPCSAWMQTPLDAATDVVFFRLNP